MSLGGLARTLLGVGLAAMTPARAEAVQNPGMFVYLDIAEPDTLDPAWRRLLLDGRLGRPDPRHPRQGPRRGGGLGPTCAA